MQSDVQELGAHTRASTYCDDCPHLHPRRPKTTYVATIPWAKGGTQIVPGLLNTKSETQSITALPGRAGKSQHAQLRQQLWSPSASREVAEATGLATWSEAQKEEDWKAADRSGHL